MKDEKELVSDGVLCIVCGELADDIAISVGYERKCFDCISE